MVMVLLTADGPMRDAVVPTFSRSEEHPRALMARTDPGRHSLRRSGRAGPLVRPGGWRAVL